MCGDTRGTPTDRPRPLARKRPKGGKLSLRGVSAASSVEALPLAQAALATHESSSGVSHPWTKDSARVTADALDAARRTEEAAALRARYGLLDDKRPTR